MSRYTAPLAALVLILLYSPTLRAAQIDDLRAKGLCAEIERYANTLFDATYTRCLATLEKGSLDLILISSKPVFSIEAAKKAWLLLVTFTAGKLFNDHPEISAGKIYVCDADLMKDRKAFSFSAATAKTFQRKAYNDKNVDLEKFYKQLVAQLKPVDIPKSP